jgi:hypothetical protein
MKIRKDVPTVCDEDYSLDVKEQTVIIELSIVSSFLIDQLTMPMVTDMYGGPEVIGFFQRSVAAEILAFIREGLLIDTFYEKNKNILDEEHGIRQNVTLDTIGVYQLAYDLHFMMSQYMVVMGHEDELIPEQSDIYHNERFFAARDI